MTDRQFYYDRNDKNLPLLYRRGDLGFWMGYETQVFSWDDSPGSGQRARNGDYAPSCRLEATLIIGFTEPE